MNLRLPSPVIFALSLVGLALSSCHPIEEFADSPAGNFDALWTEVDRHYCFFEEKGVDWDSVYTAYRPRIVDGMNRQQLFDVCADMLAELRDGHVNLSSGFNTSYYRAWWTDYPQNYDRRLVQEHYLYFDWRQVGGISYGILPQNVGYISYPSFSYALGEGNLDAILSYFATTAGIIIDIRDNGGGSLTNAETLACRFLPGRTLAGYISHKTGPGHSDFSRPMAYYYEPPSDGHLLWTKPVVVLTNRSTFSAANNFVAVMRQLPQCRIVGARTGGGSGMPFSSEMPCGWSIRFSACPILDAQGVPTETGIDPSDGCAVDLDPEAALQGHDTIIDFAISLIINQAQ